MDQVVEVTSSQPAVVISTDTNVDRFIDQCRKVWSKYESRGLEARHALGKLLNEHLGPSGKRQKHGAAVLRRAADELKIARSELTRMKKFAAQFVSLAAFEEQRPDCKTWTQVKQLIAKPASVPGKHTSDRAQVPGVIRAAESMAKKLRLGITPKDSAQEGMLRQNLRELVEVASSYLQTPQLQQT